jgi:hypothetical protein
VQTRASSLVCVSRRPVPCTVVSVELQNSQGVACVKVWRVTGPVEESRGRASMHVSILTERVFSSLQSLQICTFSISVISPVAHIFGRRSVPLRGGSLFVPASSLTFVGITRQLPTVNGSALKCIKILNRTGLGPAGTELDCRDFMYHSFSASYALHITCKHPYRPRGR